MFNRKDRPRSGRREHSIDDLMVLNRLPEAEKRLRQSLKEHPDPQMLLKLGDVLSRMGRVDDAVREYLEASEVFLEKGFLNRARAAALRARKLGPPRHDVEQMFQRLERQQRSERLRADAVDGLVRAAESGGLSVPRFELEQLWDRLSGLDFLRAMPDRDVATLLVRMRLIRCDENVRLVAEGENRPQLMLVCTGELEARRISSQGIITLRSFGAGDVLGERSLLRQELWPVSVIACRPGRVLVLDRAGFEASLVGNPDPRSFIDRLRSQGHDEELMELIRRDG